jgi:hypothetical protein
MPGTTEKYNKEKETRLMDAISARNARRLATLTQVAAEHASVHAEARSDWPCKLRQNGACQSAGVNMDEVLVQCTDVVTSDTKHWYTRGSSERMK